MMVARRVYMESVVVMFGVQDGDSGLVEGGGEQAPEGAAPFWQTKEPEMVAPGVDGWVLRQTRVAMVWS